MAGYFSWFLGYIAGFPLSRLFCGFYIFPTVFFCFSFDGVSGNPICSTLSMLCTMVLYHCRDWWNISEGIFPWTTVLLFNKYNKLIILIITSTQHLSIYLSLWLPPWRYFFSLSDPNSRAILWYCCLIRCPRTRVNAIESEVLDLELSCLRKATDTTLKGIRPTVVVLCAPLDRAGYLHANIPISWLRHWIGLITRWSDETAWFPSTTTCWLVDERNRRNYQRR